ncbi:5-carboxymethyl-2-hydroxymuconate Delta-isomerase [Tateyamaria omphalii]|uniref:5-carboxymethyl-2-hydroxymuconate isomerase n=1 Tax=Tateyamaria omphalii TaxID=299262 RepID=A0A1P8MVU6_9RHOB|nr:5-carboxymethyl-2-hydroxymuconate Delta-isomerase [Tateyamaria omphalii]APX12131.1 hypothetical protein BWR18_10915 [Tateyamaria omphalii]
MPHIILDYSASLDEALDMHSLRVTLKDAAAATGVVPPAGIRVRAHATQHSVIADGDPRRADIGITIRLAAGRTDAQQTKATDAVFDAARVFTASHMAQYPFMLSLELREIDPHHSRKIGWIRDHLPPDMH